MRVRSGAVAVELIVAVPILMILVLAVIEFSVIFTAIKQVNFASRVGAKEASEAGSTANLTTMVSNGTLRGLIDRQLQAAGATGACQVVVQYGTGNSFTTLVDPLAPACDCGVSLFPGPNVGTFVRVQVGVFLGDFCPDLLAPFGFSIAGYKLAATTTYRLEQ